MFRLFLHTILFLIVHIVIFVFFHLHIFIKHAEIRFFLDAVHGPSQFRPEFRVTGTHRQTALRSKFAVGSDWRQRPLRPLIHIRSSFLARCFHHRFRLFTVMSFILIFFRDDAELARLIYLLTLRELLLMQSVRLLITLI